MAQDSLLETGHAFIHADRHGRTEVGCSLGADGVLRYGHPSLTRGESETAMCRIFEARQEAMTAWRQARRPLPV
jgi:hypothetical protein